ncbi:sigma-70 family RNA polymerase sigma factor [Promicromonospora sukumoe]|uniref:sigma-70 family RNA polymerase sigma factor n=1 Tax=Promicromonospora sukumoe TaxID=88382 RepID=UPI0003825CFD|nr:sigma-70 family RNA polymerase sigma factor [Promicromonospora sukumoe]
MDDLQITQDNRRWVRDLGATGPVREAACAELYSLLHRVARREVTRRASSLRMYGPEVDDIAHQAASDALMAISRRLDTFRGESRFTTWAFKFVIFDVATKMNRHYWRHHDVPYDHEDWSRLASRVEATPGQEVEAADLVEAVSGAVKRSLTDRQRLVFLATVVNEVPMDALAEELGSSRNALYKVLFDARRKLRAELVAAGYLPAQPSSTRV